MKMFGDEGGLVNSCDRGFDKLEWRVGMWKRELIGLLE